MAIQQAQAKFYQAFKVAVIDQSGSAALTAGFSMGHRDANTANILADVKVSRIQRANNTRFSVNSSVSADGKFAIKGGLIKGNQGLRATTRLQLRFPTFVKIDIDQFNLPEGANVTLQLEPGFVIEQTAKFPFALGAPLAGFDLLTFRTPKRLASQLMVSAADLNFIPLRIKQLGSTLSSQASLLALPIFNPGKLAALFGGNFVTVTNPDIVAVAAAELLSDTVLISDNTRLRFGQSAVESSVNLTAEALEGLKTVVVDTECVSTLTADVNFDASINLITNSFATVDLIADRTRDNTSNSLSNFTIDAAAIKEVSAVATATTLSSLSCQINYVASSIECNIESTTTLEQNHDLVFTYFGQEFSGNIFLNAFREGQFTSNGTIFWGDGTSETIGSVGVNIAHTYPVLQEYTVRVRVPSGQELLGFNITEVGSDNAINGRTIRKIKTFGQIGIRNIQELVSGGLEAAWIEELPDALPPTVTKMERTFQGGQFYFNWLEPFTITANGVIIPAKNHNLIGKRIQTWDVSNVTNFQSCWVDSFKNSTLTLDYAQMDLRLWNTQSATNMERMFFRSAINQDLSGWCVPLIASEPVDFYVKLANAPASAPLFQDPVWGTCP